MNFLFIVGTEKFDYDEYDSVVVVAETRKKAIELAKTKLPGSAKDFYVKKIGTAGENVKGIVHTSFNAG